MGSKPTGPTVPQVLKPTALRGPPKANQGKALEQGFPWRFHVRLEVKDQWLVAVNGQLTIYKQDLISNGWYRVREIQHQNALKNNSRLGITLLETNIFHPSRHF